MHDTIFLQTGQTHDPDPLLGIIFDNPILNNIDQTPNTDLHLKHNNVTFYL